MATEVAGGPPCRVGEAEANNGELSAEHAHTSLS
jgi:hypothetical protein